MKAFWVGSRKQLDCQLFCHFPAATSVQESWSPLRTLLPSVVKTLIGYIKQIQTLADLVAECYILCLRRIKLHSVCRNSPRLLKVLFFLSVSTPCFCLLVEDSISFLWETALQAQEHVTEWVALQFSKGTSASTKNTKGHPHRRRLNVSFPSRNTNCQFTTL